MARHQILTWMAVGASGSDQIIGQYQTPRDVGSAQAGGAIRISSRSSMHERHSCMQAALTSLTLSAPASCPAPVNGFSHTSGPQCPILLAQSGLDLAEAEELWSQSLCSQPCAAGGGGWPTRWASLAAAGLAVCTAFLQCAPKRN